MIYYDYTRDDVVDSVKKKIESIIGLSYDNLLDVSKKIRKIYSNTVIDNEYYDRYKKIYYGYNNYNFDKTNNVCVDFIKRISIVNNISSKVEKGSSTFSTVSSCMCLSYLINHELLDLPLFWKLYKDIYNKRFMVDIDYLVYDYYSLLTYIYLHYTEELKNNFSEYFNDLNIYNYDDIIKFTLTKIK